jgi:hypothetical protein
MEEKMEQTYQMMQLRYPLGDGKFLLIVGYPLGGSKSIDLVRTTKP